MAPGQLCSAALHNCRIGPRRGERPHVLEVARRVTLGVGEPFPQVGGQSVDDFRAPAFLGLAGQDVGPNRPVGGNQFPVGRSDRAAVTAAHPARDRLHQLRVPGGHGLTTGRRGERGPFGRVGVRHLHHRLHPFLCVLDAELAGHELRKQHVTDLAKSQ